MAQELKRGCGYRKVGGLYFVGDYLSVPCDRLPYALTVCPCCGNGIKVGRGFTKINPVKLFSQHEPCGDYLPCFVCQPKDEVAFIMRVGEKFYPTPADFLNEGKLQGISKRIPFIPDEFEVGKTVIFLAHPRACEVIEPVAVQQAMEILEATQPRLVDAEKKEKTLGIFSAFIPQRIEKLVWESEATPENLEKLEKRGITPVIIKDGDSDHTSKGSGD